MIADLHIEFADHLAEIGRSILIDKFRHGVVASTKRDGTQVTAADIECEQRLREEISARWPKHGISGEEFGLERPGARWRWILDPLDGTSEFLLGSPLWGILIALSIDRNLALGVIDLPCLRMRWLGAPGLGVWKDGCKTPVTVRNCPSLTNATVATFGPREQSEDSFARIARAHDGAGKIAYGITGGLAYGLLAEGRIDAIIDADLDIYDKAAGTALIRAAGGTITDWDGRAVESDSSRTLLATGDPRLHAQILDVLSSS